MAFISTPAHEAIFAAIRRKTGNIQIEAVAGSGKTTTIVEAVHLIPPTESVLFLAFNKSIADELAARLPARCETRTMNALGHRLFGAYCRRNGIHRVAVDGSKLDKIARVAVDGKVGNTDLAAVRGEVVRLARVARMAGMIVDGDGLVADTLPEWERLADHFGLFEDGNVEDVVGAARKLITVATDIALGRKGPAAIDFDEQIYLPFLLDIQSFRFDRVLVDEAQDLSPLQHDLLARVLKRNGQLVAVGDPCQAIYGFRGADSRSMETLRNRFRMTVLPLHVSYRCPQAVARLAQAVVPHIEAHPEAPEGEIIGGLNAALSVDAFERRAAAGDMVVSRTTAPAVALCYRFLRAGRRAAVLGRDIGKGLTSLVEKLRPADLADLDAKLAAYETREVEKLRRRDAGEAAHVALADKVETLRVLASEADDVRGLLAAIEDLFAERPDARGVTLCTVHKAKGLEAHTVWILNPHLMPHPMARSAWEREQEQNLKYVAITRAKQTLGFVAFEAKPRKKPETV